MFMRETSMASRVTIKSIARDLGISHMTVSRALSGHPNVHEKTRARIEQRARELGYVKSAAANAMRGEPVNVVGLLLPNIVNEFYARFADAMAEACERSGNQMIIHLTNDEIERERNAIARLRELQARAVVMVPAPGAGQDVITLLNGMRTIELIRRRTPNAEGAITVEDHRAIHDAVAYLAGLGHMRIGYIGASAEFSSGKVRVAAFREGLKNAGLTQNPALTITTNPSFKAGHGVAENWLAEGMVDAIVCGGFELSNGALGALAAVSNGEVGFVGYGDPLFYQWVARGVSTIHVPIDPLAKRAVELAVKDVERDKDEAETVVAFEAELIVRGEKGGVRDPEPG